MATDKKPLSEERTKIIYKKMRELILNNRSKNDVSNEFLDSFLCKCKTPEIVEQKGMNFCKKCRKEVELFN